MLLMHKISGKYPDRIHYLKIKTGDRCFFAYANLERFLINVSAGVAKQDFMMIKEYFGCYCWYISLTFHSWC